MPEGKVKVQMPHKGRTGVVEITCETETVVVPKGPYRFATGSRKGQFVPIADVKRNFAKLVENVQKATKARRKAQ